MKIFLFFSFMAFFTSVLNAQQFSLQIKRPAIKNIGSIEEKAGGKQFKFSSNIRFSVSKGYFPGSDRYNLDNPLTFNRSEPVPIQTQYYYSLPDSVVRLIEYTLNNSDTALLQKTFNDNAKQIEKLIGWSVSDSSENHDDWWERTAVWEDTHTYIKQFMIIGSGTYRVRILISWK
ncbi:MAG: hypothetical protein QM764_18515 [Chitinophagaceae bacterium]